MIGFIVVFGYCVSGDVCGLVRVFEFVISGYV